MVVGNRSPSHQGRDDGHARDLRELHQQRRRIGVDDAAAGGDQGAPRRVEHVERFLDLGARCLRLVQRQRRIGVAVELDLRHLHVDRQVDQHRAGPARAHQVEGLLEDARHQRRLAHRHRPLGHRPRDRLDVDRLEVFLVQAGARRLAGNAKNRYRIGLRRVQACDHVRAGRPGSADAHAQVAGLGAGIALGHVRGAFDVARQVVADAVALAQRGVEGIDRGAGHAEGDLDAFFFHHQHRCLCCCHPCHSDLQAHERTIAMNVC